MMNPDNRDLAISDGEYQALAARRPDLARQLTQEIMQLRAEAPVDQPATSGGTQSQSGARPPPAGTGAEAAAGAEVPARASTPDEPDMPAGVDAATGPEAPAWLDSWAPLHVLSEAYDPRPPVEYLVSDLLPLPSLTMIYAPAGSMKSLLLMDLAVCVSMGQPWLSPVAPCSLPPFQVMQAGVLWVDLDQGENTMFERLEAFGRGHGGPQREGRLFWKTMPPGGFNLPDKVQLGEMAIRVRDLGARLLCLDNLGNSEGGADENSSQMIPVLAALRWLAEDLKIAVVVLHHSRKENGFKSRYGDLVRGHSSIIGGLDLAMGVDHEDESDAVVLRPGKVRHASVGTLEALFQYTHRPGGRQLAVATFGRLDIGSVQNGAGKAAGRAISRAMSQERAAADKRRRLEIAIDQAILESLEGHCLNQSQVIARVERSLPDAGDNRIRQRLDRLAQDGRIAARRGMKNALFFNLNRGEHDTFQD